IGFILNLDVKTILLVEDEVIIALLEEATLASAGYRVLRAGTGETAVAMVGENPAIDLVLMDIDLGDGIDGTEAATQILNIRQLPIVFLTSHGEQEMVERVKGITRYGYVLKSSGEFVLLESVAMAFELFNREDGVRNAWREQHALQQMLRTIVENSPTAVVLLDRELRYRMVSNTFLRNYGLENKDVLGRRHYDLFPDIPEKWREVHRRSLRGEVLRSEDDFMVHPDGRISFSRWECRPWHGSDGSIEGIILHTEEITQEKEAQSRQRSIQGALNAVMANVPDIVCVLDPWGRFKMISESMAQALGKPRNSILDQKIEEVIEPELARRFRAHLDEVVATNGRISTEDEVHNALGRRIYRTRFFPVDLRSHGVSLVGILSVDVTDILDAKRKLEMSEARWKYALEGPGDALWDLDVATGESYVSGRWQEMLGYDSTDIAGNRDEWEELIHPEDSRRVLASLEAALAGEQAEYREEYRLLCKDGSYKWILDRGKVVERDGKGNPVRMIGTHTDISRRKEAEARAEDLIRQRELMVREGHHRVKNDMQSVRSLLSLQASRSSSVEVREALQEAAGRIEIIASLYDTMYRSALNNKDREVRTIVTEVIDSLRARLGSEAPTITVSGSAGRVKLRGNTPLAVVVNEILTNAAKYGRGQEGGAVSVAVELRRESDGSRSITITDEGPGFPEPVLRGDAEGFGLTVVRAFVDQIDGSLTLANRGDRGARVTVSFGPEV
ncbi:MAG: PAS domain S-box protein, partial [Alkalispirochaetaceae bacterium]